MHIKTNIELNIVHFVILAICPIMFITSNTREALCLALMAIVAFVCSVFVCSIFNKFLRRSQKIFLTAVLSSMIVTLLNIALTKFNFMGLESSDKFYFAALSAIILAVDIYYIDTKALASGMVMKLVFAIWLFLGLFIIYSIIVEFLSFGTIFAYKFTAFNGIEFFASVPFGLILLGFICAVAESIYNLTSKHLYNKRIAYEKFVKKIRNEKIFQYDTLRRKKILTNEIEVREIDVDEAETLQEKSNENEVIDTDADPQEEQENETEEKKPKKRKKNKKLKVSKGAKIEKVFDRQTKEGE